MQNDNAGSAGRRITMDNSRSFEGRTGGDGLENPLIDNGLMGSQRWRGEAR